MPEISRFFGIVISMFYDEHNPPHFHARYGEFKAQIVIESLVVKEGFLPARVLGLVVEWASMHKPELLENWNNAKKTIEPNKIAPLI